MEEYITRSTAETEEMCIRDSLYTGEDGRLLSKWNGPKEETPPLFSVSTGAPADSFVRFRMQAAPGEESRLWMDETIRQSFIDYQNSLCLLYTSRCV